MEELETADVRPTRQQFPYAGAFEIAPKKICHQNGHGHNSAGL